MRKHHSKSFLTVLDFISNHNKAFLIAIALNGSRFYDKDSLKVAVVNDFSNIGGCTNIQMDRISQERILQQLSFENFNSLRYLREEYNEFKNMRAAHIPLSLMDYIIFDGAPDPIKFIEKEKTYLEFLAKMEKDDKFKKLLKKEAFIKVLREISGMLPIKRVYEFAIFRYLINHEKINIDQARNEVAKYTETVTDEDIIHAFKYMDQQYLDPAQKQARVKCFSLDNTSLSRVLALESIIKDESLVYWINDTLNYGVNRYERDFGSEYYGIPFLKRYEQYKMIDVALMSNYTKTHSAYRGSGLLTNGKDYFLFVDLNKGENIKEAINYKDELISTEEFQWQSPNATRQNSERGKNIIFNVERDIRLHLFIRKFKMIDSATQPYIYLGQGDTIKNSQIGEKPITIRMKLQNVIPISLFRDLTEVVEIPNKNKQ